MVREHQKAEAESIWGIEEGRLGDGTKLKV